MYCIEYIQSTMSIKELKADNLLLQAKLDDALAEIKELTNLVEHMEKEKYNGIECVDEPYETGLFRIDQININYLHTRAIEWLKTNENLEYGPALAFPSVDEPFLISIAHDLAARMESMESDVHQMVEDAIGEVIELYKDRFESDDEREEGTFQRLVKEERARKGL